MKVLIIDDEPLVRATLGYALSAAGWEVFEHDQHADFPGLIREHGIDVVITDYRMGKVTGLDLIEMMREAGLGIPALILSGNVYVIDRNRAKLLGVLEILTKPPNLKQLLRTLARAVAGGNADRPLLERR
jgi:DNA-binding NtrC family response regulator